jgi:glycosyltransferase involved in cell wall biosynthesis
MKIPYRQVRVIIQLNQLGYGGTEKAVLTILKYIDPRRFHVQVIFTSSGGTLKFIKYFILKFFSSHYERMFKERFVTAYARLDDFRRFANGGLIRASGWGGFRKAVEEFRPDLIHFNRGVEKEFYSMRLNELQGPKFIETSIFGRSGPSNYVQQLSRAIFVSDWLLHSSTLAKEVPSVRLYNPVEAIQLVHNREMLSRSEGQDKLTIGRLSRPNLDDGRFVADVILPLLERNPNVFFRSIGSSDSFIRITSFHPRVSHSPPTVLEDDIFDFLEDLDVLLHYRVEGETFGLSIAEAMSLGKPVVSHRSEVDNAQVEILTAFGDAGLIVDNASSVEGFQELLQKLIDSQTLREALGRQGRAVANENFDPVLITRKLESLYIEVLSS